MEKRSTVAMTGPGELAMKFMTVFRFIRTNAAPAAFARNLIIIVSGWGKINKGRTYAMMK